MMSSRASRDSNEVGREAASFHDPLRRMVLAGIGGAAIFSGFSGFSASDQTRTSTNRTDREGEVFNAANRMRDFDRGGLDNNPPWVAKQHGNFDLTDPVQANLARLKMTNNLVGKRTYIPMFVRLMLGREREPGGVLLGAAGLFIWQLQVPDPNEFPDAPEGTVQLRSHYNSTYLDPSTMEPVETLWNPFKKVEMKLQDLLFAENMLNYPLGGGLFVEEPQFANDPPDVPKIPQFQDFGDELVLFQGGTYSEPGAHQPRFTENMWVSNRQDVMDPGKHLIDMRYTFAGANKAWEKSWTGYNQGEEDLLIDLAMGKKVHSLDELPRIHREHIAEKYPHRM